MHARHAKKQSASISAWRALTITTVVLYAALNNAVVYWCGTQTCSWAVNFFLGDMSHKVLYGTKATMFAIRLPSPSIYIETVCE